MRVPPSGTPGFGPIDCDVHPAMPDVRQLLPYFDEYWREQITNRGLERNDFSLTSYPAAAPLFGRPDWRPAQGLPGRNAATLCAEALDPFGSSHAILNVLHGCQALYTEDMALAFCRAINDWVAREWLDRDPRLRAAIVIPIQNPDLAAEEIERVAADRRFVQVLVLVMGDMPLGRRGYWPIYRAAERLGLPVGIHAGSTYRHAPTPMGFPSFHLEDYVGQAQAFDSQLLSLIAEGVFAKFPALKIVMIESGFTWLPTFLWRTNKIWRGLRAEVPWVKRPPAEIVRESVRFTLQPVDAPPDAAMLTRTMEQIGSDDVLLFSTDYPHWHFDGEDVLPEGLPAATLRKLLVENPLATYPRLHPSTEAGATLPATQESAA
jgi:predicted TIM-barrel fold metal-dependent hydrolase